MVVRVQGSGLPDWDGQSGSLLWGCVVYVCTQFEAISEGCRVPMASGSCLLARLGMRACWVGPAGTEIFMG